MSRKTFRKAVACVLAATLSVGATTYSSNRVSRRNMVSPNAHTASLGMDNLVRLSIAEAVKVTVPKTATVTTTGFSTTTSNTTSTTETTTTSVTTTETTTSSSTTSVVTSTIPEVTQPVTEAPTEETVETPVEQSEPEIEEVQETTEAPREYVVYKPSTHYIHRSTCHWCNSECYEIDSTEGLEARRCSECAPDMDIITPYEEPKPVEVSTAPTDTAIQVTDYEYIILCNLVAGEYGSNIVSTYDKGAVVATVIHRLWEGTRWTGGASASIYNVIAAPYQYSGKYLEGSYRYNVTQSCKDAVTYALNNIHDYDYYTNPDGTSIYMINSFTGDGRYNWFRHN